MTAAIDKAMARLAAVFGDPKTPDPELYLEEFRKALDGMDPIVLSKAVDAWMRKDTAYWPRPGEIVALAQTVAADVYQSRRPAEHQPIPNRDPLDPEVKARVEAMIKSAIDGMKEQGHVEGEASKAQWQRGQRGEFEAMQASSRTRLHRKAAGLTETSKRMTGERE